MLIHLPLTVSTSAYAAGNNVGGKLVFPGLIAGAGRVAIVDALLIDKSIQNVSYELHFFDADLATGPTDKAAYNIAVGDLPKHQGFLSLSGMAALGTGGGVINTSNIYKRLTLGQLGTAWGVLITRGAPTFAATTDVILRLQTEVVGAS